MKPYGKRLVAPQCACIHGMVARAVLFFVFCGAGSWVHGQATFTWDAGGNPDNWTVANNWNPNGAPAAGTLSNYVFNSTGGTSNVADGATAWEVNSLTFGSSAGSFTISSTAGLKLYAGGIVQNDGSTQTISAAIALQADSFVSGSGSGAVTLSGIISGAYGLTKSTSGTLTLSGANTYTGATIINSGTLSISSEARLGNNPSSFNAGQLTLDGGTLAPSASFTIADANRGITIGSSGGTFNTGSNTLTLNSVVGGTGTLTKSGTGILVLGGSSAHTHTGNIAVTVGTLRVDNSVSNGAIGDTAAVTVSSGATLSFNNGQSETISSLAGAGTVDNVNASATTLTTGDSTNTVFSGILKNTSGALGLTKMGSGTFTLSGTNTYAGTTTISAGTLQIGNAGTTGTLGTGAVVNDANLTINRTNALTVSNAISGTGNLIQAGTGTTTLTGTNTYAGTTTISAGTLQIGAAGTTGTLGTGAVINSANLTFSRSDALAVANDISGTGNVTKAGAGTTTFTGSNTYSGATTISAGVLQIGDGGTTGSLGTGAVSVSNAAALAFNRSDTITIANAISGTGGALTQAGSGTTILTGANAYTGITTISAGTLQIGNGGTTGSLGTGAVTNNGNLTFDRSNALAVANNISGTGNLTQAGSGTTTLSGTNTYTGTTTITGGTLSISSEARLGSDPGAFNAGQLTLDGGTLAPSASFTINDANRGITIGSNGGTFNTGTNTLTLRSIIAGAGELTKSGSGILVINGSSANTHSGNIAITAGTLRVDKTLANGAFGDTAAVNVSSGATLSFNSGQSETIGSLVGAGTVDNTNATAMTLTTGDSTNTVFSGVLQDTSGNLSLTKAGSGTFTLSGANTYAGTTTINAGTLQIGDAGTTGTLGTGAVTNNANLVFNRTNALAVSNNIGGSGNVTQAGSGSTTLSGTNSYSGATTVNAGTLIASGSSSLGASAGTTTVNAGSLSLAGGTTITKSGLLSLAGTGTSATVGALHAGGGTGTTSAWKGNISLAANATITAADNLLILGEGTTFTNTITLGANTLTFHTPNAATVTPTYEPGSYTLDAANVMVNSAINGTGGVTKTGVGTLILIPLTPGGSGFTGPLTITGGKVIVDGYEDAGPTYHPGVRSTEIYVGNASSPGSPDSVVLQMGQLASPPAANNTIGTYNVSTNASGSNITIYSDGAFLMNQAANGFVNINLQGGHINGGTSAAALTVSGGITTTGNANTAVIENGSLRMSANSFTFNVADGAAAVDLRVDNTVQSGVGYTGSGSGTGLVKSGLGTMVLTGANTYQGISNISEGILNIRNAGALGQYGGSLGDLSNGTTVQSGAQLQLEHATALTVALETLTLKGTGVGGTGALLNVGGNNTYNGFIYLGADSRINANTGTTLTIANTSGVNAAIINGDASGRNLTFGGAGNITVNGGISSFINNVAKDGTGTLTLAGNNGYAGTTTVGTGGAIKVTHNNGLSGTGVTVNSGGALQFAQAAGSVDINVVAVPASISGTGVSNDGAIRNLNGSNSFLGAITLNDASRINADSGSNFTLSGGISSQNKALTVGGAGNITVSATINLDALSSGTRGSLTKDGGGTFTFASAGTLTGTVGKLHIDNGTFKVGGTGTATLNTDELTATASLGTLLIASGGTVNAVFDEGITAYNGILSGSSVGTLALSSTGANNSGIQFTNTVNAPGLTLKVGGSTIGGSSEAEYFTLTFGGSQDITVGTLHITGDTILDFNNSAGTFLSSATLIIDAGVKILVKNWISVADNAASSTVWYVTGATNGIQGSLGNLTLGGVDIVGNHPLNQITFSSYSGLTTTWVSGNHSGWFDREIRPAPEPGTYGAIFLSSCLGLIGWRRFRSRQKTARS